MKVTKYTAILILFPFLLMGQTNFQKGYLVNLSGDTLRGEIDNRDWSKSPEVIRFRKSKNAEIQKFSAYQCQGMGLETGLSYRSFQTTLYRTKEYHDRPNYETVKDTTVFMEVIAKGKQTLLEFVEKGEKSRFFIQKNQIQKEQLIYHSYYSGTKLFHNRQYQKQLAELKPNAQTENLTYERHTLTKFINDINRTSTVQINKEKPQKSVILNVGIGAVFYQTHTISKLETDEELATFEANIKPALGLNVTFPFSKKFNSFAFNVGVLFSPYTAAKKSGDRYGSLSKVHANNLFMNLGIKYMLFTKKELRPYIGVGVGINEPLGDYLIRTDGKRFKLPIKPQNGDFEFNIHQARFYVNTGVQINKKLSGEIRYDRILDYNILSGTKSPLSSLSCLFYWSIN
jgi:DNA-binding XRE family transcriptional regulator